MVSTQTVRPLAATWITRMLDLVRAPWVCVKPFITVPPLYGEGQTAKPSAGGD